MPFTPFHFGPGLFLKSLAKQFSFTVFVFSQVAIDLETLYYILTNDPPLHRLLHTFLGANLVVLVSVLMGKPICEWGLKISGKLIRFKREVKISWVAAISSAFLGAYSHIFFDSLMHRDIHPFWPFTDGNPLLGIVSISQLHWFCVAAFAVGGAAYLLGKGYKLLLNLRENKAS